MRKAIVIENCRCYHLISRLAHRAFFLDDDEKSRAVELLRRVEEFCGVMVLAYAIMSNHFHIFIYVPEPEDIGDEEILRRINALYREASLAQVLGEWMRLKDEETDLFKRACPKKKFVSRFRDYRRSFLRRMWNSSEFMRRTFKQHFTMSFNGRRDHYGTMWELRYRVRVKGPAECGMMLAESCYVDANSVNAGIVCWLDGYEWCSYAAACRGDETARSGYDFVYGGKGRPWPELKELHDISIRQMLKEREWKDSEDVELARANKRPDGAARHLRLGSRRRGIYRRSSRRATTSAQSGLCSFFSGSRSRRHICARRLVSRAGSISRRRISVR